jgi:hypothetical protein
MSLDDGVFIIGAFVLLVLTIGSLAGSSVYLLYDSDAEYTITINEKWIKGQGDEGQKYLMSDLQGNVFSIEDSWWKWTFDASNRYAEIKQNHTYLIKTFGRRSPFFSNYPNAIEIREIT